MILKGRYERTAIADVLNPINGYRGQQELFGLVPKDHRKDNLKFIKQKQEENKKKQDEESKVKPEPFKLKKFANVPSKLSTIDTAESPRKQERPQTAASGRARSTHGIAPHVAFGRTTCQFTSELPSERGHTIEDDKENMSTYANQQ
jgi:hypothetical protein